MRKRTVVATLLSALSIGILARAAIADPPIMTLPGQFGVSQTGAATYGIPIAVPPGTAGMVPALALDYSSQGGDGIVGWQWSLDGLPTITRCSRTIALDGVRGGVNYDANDRFCIGGQRLILTSGTYGADGSQYHTEIESFAKVIAHGSAGTGPAWFEVHTKGGKTLEFGNTTDSRALAVGGTTARLWAVNKMLDTRGNYLTATYTNDTTNGQIYPTRIDYTGNSGAGLSTYNSVQFTYSTTRVDVTPTYQAGSIIQTTVLLTDVKTYTGTSVVYDYQLAYRAGTSTTHSRLTSVTLCDSAGTTCLPATTFAWQGGTGLPTMNGTTISLAQGASLVPGDFNGDGLTDVMIHGGSNCGIWMGSITGSFSASSYTADYTLWEVESGHYTSTDITGGDTCFETTFARGSRVASDFNGDGYSDVTITQDHAVNTPYQHVLFNDESSVLVQGGVFPSVAPAAIADFNGDGRADILAKTSPSGGYQVDLSNGDGTFTGGATASGTLSMATGDFDGDGCADMLQSGSTRAIVYSCNPATASTTVGPWAGATLVLGDFNGDGKTDILVTYPAAAGTLYLSTGTGLMATSFSVPSDWGKYTIVVGDWNGDGKDDIALVAAGGSGMYTYGTDHQILLSTGSGFVSATTISNSNSADTSERANVADWTSIGSGAIWLQRPSGDAIYSFASVPEVVTSVSNGIGATTSITYDRINKNGTFYSKSTASFPQVAIDGPLYVVSQVSTSNGIGGTYTQTYTYAGAFGNAGAYFYTRASGGMSSYAFAGIGSGTAGPVLFGFAQIAASDQQTGLVTTTTYRTDYPYVGRVSSQTVATTNTRNGCTAGKTIRSVSNTYGVTPATTSPAPYFVYLQESVLSGQDCDGSALPQTTTDYTYDAYGNPTVINKTVALSGTTSSTSVTNNTFSNDTTNWLFLLTQTAVTNTKSGSSVTRTTNIGYQSGTNVVNDVTVEPGSTTLLRDTAFTIDTFGNQTGATTSGSNFTTRSVSATFDTQGRFALSVTDALTHSRSFTWDARFGAIATRTDVNGLVTIWLYDGLGRRTKETRPDGNYTSYTVGLCGGSCPTNAVYEVSATGYSSGAVQNAPLVASYYDVLNRDVYDTTNSFSGNVEVSTIYNGNGQPAQISRPYSGTPVWTVYAYDDLGRAKTVTAPNSGVTSVVYSGLSTTVTDPLSHSRTTTRNSEGLVASVTDAASNTTTYAYDPFGNAKTITDPSGNVISNTFDLRGNETASSDPDLGAWSFTYDGLGELLTQTDAKSQVASLTYDLNGRVTERGESGFVTDWIYDSATHGVGLLQKACTSASSNPTCASATTTRTLTYDTLSRASTTTINIHSTDYVYTTTYSSDDRIDTITYPSSFAAKYVYTSYGYLSQIKDNASGSAIYTVNALNDDMNVTSSTAGNGVASTLSYDSNTGFLTGVRAGPSNTVASFDYQYDSIGNLTYRSDNIQNVFERFCYDPLNRLTNSATAATTPSTCSSTGTGIISKTIGFDLLGDITSKSDVGTYSYPSSGSARPHAVSSITGTVNGVTNPSYSYDGNGNLTGGAGRSVTYTAFNMTASITQGSVANCWTYDSNHMRIRMEVHATSCTGTLSATELYLNDSVSGAMSERSIVGGTTVWNDYVRAGNTIVAERFCTGTAPCSTGATWQYFIVDHLGSTAVLTNGSGGVTERLSYDAWGRRRNSDGTDNSACSITSATSRGYTGHEELDSLCQVDANARIYDPTVARFASPDPIAQDPRNTQSLARYTYVLNRPLSAIDPSGNELVTVIGHPTSPIDGNFGGGGGDGGGSGGEGNSNGATSSNPVETILVYGQRAPIGDILAPNQNTGSNTAGPGQPACPTGGYRQISFGGSATAAVFGGITISVSAGESYSTDPSAVTQGTQFFFNISIAGHVGLGAFLGGGVQGTYGGSNGPLQTASLAAPYDGEVEGGYITTVGVSGQVDPSGGSASASAGLPIPKAGAGIGLYAGGGRALSLTFATPQMDCR